MTALYKDKKAEATFHALGLSAMARGAAERATTPTALMEPALLDDMHFEGCYLKTKTLQEKNSQSPNRTV